MILLLSAVAATAAPPTRIPFEVDVTFQHGFLTARCGVPVFLHIEGGGTVTLFYDQDGNLIQELDTIPGGIEFTFFSPTEAGGTGKSLSFTQYGKVTFTYPEGTDIGDPSIISTVGPTGPGGRGGPTSAGRQVAEGVIIGHTQEGIPLVEPVAIISESGHFSDPAAVTADRCSVLADP